jgi:TonB family protein
MGILLGGMLCLAQTNAPSRAQPAEPKTSSSFQGGDAAAKIRAALEEHIKGKANGIEILTDTQGIDFGPYLNEQVLRSVRWNWNVLLPDEARPPQSKQGRVVIDFFILKDGTVAGMKVVDSSGDITLDRAAYGSIKNSVPFKPLPTQFTGHYLGLRLHFYYNTEAKKPGFSISPVESTVAVSSSVQFRAAENEKDAAVTWSITACNDSCGTIFPTGLYTAPPKIPNPPKVGICAKLVSNPDYNVGATVTVIEPKP